MNYKEIYENLIKRGKNRDVQGYTERHHVIPKCMGGTDDSDNLVRLTPEEHFLAHQLLVKIYPSHRGLLNATIMMTTHHTENRINNKLYGWLKKRFIESMSGDNNPARRIPGLQAKAGQKRKGQKRTAETKSNISAALYGKPFTESHLSNLKLAASNRKRPLDGISVYVYDDVGNFEMSFENCYDCAKYLDTGIGMIKGVLNNKHQHVKRKRLYYEYMGEKINPLEIVYSSRGKKKTEMHVENQKKSLAVRYTCVHCKFSSSKSAINRYHNDRCPENPNRKVSSKVLLKTHVCPNCNKVGTGSVMFRHHYDNCKHKKN